MQSREAASWIYPGGSQVAMGSLLGNYTQLSVGTVLPQHLLQNCEIRMLVPELGERLCQPSGCSAWLVLYPSGYSLIVTDGPGEGPQPLYYVWWVCCYYLHFSMHLPLLTF